MKPLSSFGHPHIYRFTGAVIVFFELLLFFASFKDVDPILKTIVSQLERWSSEQPVEKVYLQLDKPYYAAGDDIWFKAYVTLGDKHKLSGLSGVLNVELINDRGIIKRHIKLPIVSGLAWGDFSLSDTVQEGNFRIRAYTDYMRNAGEPYFFDEQIAIANSLSNEVFTKASYSYAVEDGKNKTFVLINYKDAQGAPLSRQKVRYSIELNSKAFASGNGETDMKGNLRLNFKSTVNLAFQSGELVTSLELANKEKIRKVIPITAISNQVDVQFFPEGGTLVNGVLSKVGFKALGSDGLGVDIKGSIIDDQNKIVESFSSQHLGMGFFNLEPVAGVIYKTKVSFSDGSEKVIALPRAVDNAYVLSLDMTNPESILIRIGAGSQMLRDHANDTLSLVAQSNGHVYYAASTVGGSKYSTSHIAKNKFPSGVVQFTLFSSKGEPLNERLVCIQNSDQLKVDLGSDKQQYTVGEKIKVNLRAETGDAKATIGNFSVSVLNENKVPTDWDSQNNISSNLLLTSDLRGYIEKPGYYFNSITEKTSSDLDVLMLTQGYHRFDWKELYNSDPKPLAFEPEKYLQISGRMTTNNGRPVSNGEVSAASFRKEQFTLDTTTDEQGRFAFRNLVFSDSINFTIQAKTAKDKTNVMIDLDQLKPQLVSQNKTSSERKININADAQEYLKSSKALYTEELKYGLVKHTIVLKEVLARGKRIVLTHSASLYGVNSGLILTGDQIPVGYTTITDALRGRIPGVNVVRDQLQNDVFESTRGFHATMSVNLDGTIIPPDAYSSIILSNIESIQVLRGNYFSGLYGNRAGPGGMIIINSKTIEETYRADLKRPAPGILGYSPIGYYKSRSFYSPKYKDPYIPNSVANLRSTVFWDPNISTDEKGQASFDYFNAGSGVYRVTVEGMDASGHIGREIYRYKVENSDLE